MEKEKEVKVIPVLGRIGKVVADEDSIEIKFSTFAIHPEEAAILLMLAKKEVYAIFKPIKFEQEDLDSLDIPDVKVDREEKTPSQRLRSVIYVEWEQLDDKKKAVYKTFDNYYRDKMEVIINWIKQKLN